MYHERFGNLHNGAVRAVDDAAPALWNTDRDGALEMLQALAAELADVYDVPTPDVEWDTREVYYGGPERIGLPRPSLVSFLHEFRHHLQQHGRQANSDIEEDARGWSISLFAEAEPDYFDRAWRDGRIWFMPPHPETGETPEVSNEGA